MKGIHGLAVSLFLLLPVLSWGKEPASQTVAPIYNVVDLVMQECRMPARVQWIIHPLRDQVQRSGLIPLDEIGYRVNFKKIPDHREWIAAVRLHDRSRDVDDSYVLFTKTGLSPFDGAYVITRLPDDISNPQDALQVVMQMQKSAAGSGKASFIGVDTPFGRGLEMVVGGRVGSACFPTSPFRYASSAQEGSIGISRFVVRGRDLIEYALVLRWPEDVSQENAITLAQSRLSDFQRGLEPLAH